MIKYFDELEYLRLYAKNEFIPIIRDRSLEILIEKIKESEPKKILELGTAIAYSTILISKNSKHEKLITIEKNKERYKKAIENIEKHNLKNIVAINDDIENFLNNTEEKFDFVFIDGPKSHYLKYVKKLENKLNENAILFSDDILFYGMVLSKEYPRKKHRTIVMNLRKYIDYMLNTDKFETNIIYEDNGLMISKYKGNKEC